jgi:hypothetical protein
MIKYGKLRQFYLLLGICSAIGLLLGGVVAQAESQQCFEADELLPNCFLSPQTRTVEGMASGVVAGGGAAVGALGRGLVRGVGDR